MFDVCVQLDSHVTFVSTPCFPLKVDVVIAVVFIVLTSIFVVVLLGVGYDLYRTQRNYRRRKEAEQAASMLWHKPPPLLPPTAPSPYKARQQGQQNGSAGKPLLKSEASSGSLGGSLGGPLGGPTSPVHVNPPQVPNNNQQNGGKQIRFQGESQ